MLFGHLVVLWHLLKHLNLNDRAIKGSMHHKGDRLVDLLTGCVEGEYNKQHVYSVFANFKPNDLIDLRQSVVCENDMGLLELI